VLVGAGDIGQCGSPGPEATARVLDGISGIVFTAGDNAYPSGRPENYRDCYHPTWGRHLERTRPSAGNHDFDQGGGPYFDYFGSRAGTPGQGFYSYRLGTSWTVVVLNSEIDARPGSPQLQWLGAELSTHATPCTAAIWHRPLFTSGPNGENRDMRDLWRVLYDFGVEFVINGHDHIYERFAPQDPTGRADPALGIRQFTVGTGGVDLYRAVAPRPNSEVIGTTWGVAKFTLSDGAYQWEFVPVAGASFRDSGSGACH
jgi:hypothetical protein